MITGTSGPLSAPFRGVEPSRGRSRGRGGGEGNCS